METVERDIELMRLAIAQAEIAAAAGEAPIGAVLADARAPIESAVLAAAHNRPIELCDPTAHAEILALRAGGASLRNYRLAGLTLYVTLEPCAMCAGAISHARIGRVVYGATDAKGGAIVSGPRFFEQPTCHWRPEVCGGVLGEESGDLLRRFFQARRKTASP